jgi:polyisoprenoid-binding protein YceI
MSRLPRLAALGLLALVACTQSASDTTARPTTTVPVDPNAPFQVTGTLTQLGAERTATDPIKPPFTITVAERGVGGAEVVGATVNGKATQINWGAGQPLPVSGTGPGIDLGIVSMALDAKTITWNLDGALRDVLPGSYTLGSPVAVGTGGLATPVDRVTFTAGNNTTLRTRGTAMISRAPAALRIEGREGALVLTGKLTLSNATGDHNVKTVTFGPGTYDVTLTPVAGGYTVVAHLQGTATTT